MEKEPEAKVVASVWGVEFFQILRASCFSSVDLEDNFEFILFFQIDRGKTDATTFAFAPVSILLLELLKEQIL